jgi:hypothetical protein
MAMLAYQNRGILNGLDRGAPAAMSFPLLKDGIRSAEPYPPAATQAA